MAAKLVPENVIISDSTVLINFIDSGNLSLLLKVYAGCLHITDIVRAEVRRGKAQLDGAIDDGKIAVHQTDLETLKHISKSFSNFDEGEASCFLLALERSWRVATDDGAGKAFIRRALGTSYVITTFDILLEARSRGLVDGNQALSVISAMTSDADFLYTREDFEAFRRALSQQ